MLCSAKLVFKYESLGHVIQRIDKKEGEVIAAVNKEEGMEYKKE